MTTQKKLIPVFYSVDDNYISILHVALESLTSQASNEYAYNIHILFEELSEENQKSLTVFDSENVSIILNNVSDVTEGYAKRFHSRYYNSKAIYYRIFIPEMFPEYDKAIYLDCDTVLNSDISELFNLNIGSNYLGAITCELVSTNPVFIAYSEKFLGIKASTYFNSGILLLNCDILRKVKFQDSFFDLLGKYKLEICPDQDYFNLLCYGKTKMLPKAWNITPLSPNGEEKLEDIKLLHYNLALKPWRYDGILYQELFWNHAKKTIFYDALLKSKKRLIKPEVSRDRQRMRALLRMAKNSVRSADETLVYKIYNGKAPDRLAVLERIKEYEKKGLYDVDVEDDPPSNKIDLKKVDFTKSTLISKIKARIATSCGRRYYKKMLKRKEVIFGDVRGLENLDGFSGGAIITCNHIHQIDNYFINITFEKIFKRFKLWKIVREGNWSFKGVLGFILRNANTIPISQTNSKMMVDCMKAVKTMLSRGEKILVYPEQAMWWLYRKPRPLKDGAFFMASKAHAPVIPCFITLKDSGLIGADGFPVQEFTLHILPVISYDDNLSVKENADNMKTKNTELWQTLYKDTYENKE